MCISSHLSAESIFMFLQKNHINKTKFVDLINKHEVFCGSATQEHPHTAL